MHVGHRVEFFSTDNIESNVETAAVRVESGNEQLESAVRAKVCDQLTLDQR